MRRLTQTYFVSQRWDDRTRRSARAESRMLLLARVPKREAPGGLRADRTSPVNIILPFGRVYAVALTRPPPGVAGVYPTPTKVPTRHTYSRCGHNGLTLHIITFVTIETDSWTNTRDRRELAAATQHTSSCFPVLVDSDSANFVRPIVHATLQVPDPRIVETTG